MRKLLLLCVFSLLGVLLFSAGVNREMAVNIAVNWINLHGEIYLSAENVESVYTNPGKTMPEYHIVSFKKRGWVIVSGSDLTEPVLGYSTDTDFDIENIPPQVKGWMGGLSDEIQKAEENKISPSPSVQKKWGDYGLKVLEKESLKSVAATQAGPLLLTTWNQGRYYNEMAPEDSRSSTGNGHVWIGCVATAMAQVMKYWGYPGSGMGNHSFVHPDYGTQSADFGNTTYNWAAMPNNVNSYNAEVQRLNYHAAVAVDMDFGPYSSGAWLEDANVGLVDYFKYNSTLFETSKNDWDDTEWIAQLKREIDAGRPIIYSGYNASYTSGHAWVCDGYSSGDYFHFNWGWGGTYNGNFLLSSLTPGSNNFSTDQGALFGMEPVLPETIPIPYGQGFETGAGVLSLMGVSSLSNQVVHTGTKSLLLGKETVKARTTNAASLCFVVPEDAELNFWVRRYTPQVSGSNQQIASLMPQYGTTPLVEIFNGDFSDSDWVNYNVDLSAYAGQIVRLLFKQQVNDVVKQQWMYIDDISITGISNNLPPYEPSSPIPSNLEDFVQLNPTLRWNGGDPNGDGLIYKIYFGTQASPPLVASVFNNYYTPQPLTHTTTYYWRVVSDDGSLTTQGPTWSFKTQGIPPDVGLCGLTDLTSSSATICGEIINQNSTTIDTRGICWTTTSIPSLSTEHIASANSGSVFSCTANGLLPYTTYNYAAYANSSQGLAYSPILSFRTLPAIPEIAFTEVKSILRSSATVVGELTAVNDSVVIKRGVVWSSTASFDPWLANEVAEEGSWDRSGNFQMKLINLPGPDTIYFRLFAENSAGRRFSNEAYFITTNRAPFIDLDANNSRGAGDSDFLGKVTEQLAGGILCDSDVVITDDDGDWITKVRIEITNPVDSLLEILNVIAEVDHLIVAGSGSAVIELSSATSFSYEQWGEIVKKVEYLNLLDAPQQGRERRISVAISDGFDWSNIALAKITVIPVNDPPVVQSLPAIASTPVLGSTISVVPGSWADLLDETNCNFSFRYWFQIKNSEGEIEVAEAKELFLLEINHYLCGKQIRVVEEVTDSGCGGNNIAVDWSISDWYFVDRAPQTITLDAIPPHPFHDQSFKLSGNSSSGLPLSYSVYENNTIAISNDTVFMLNTGTVVITGIQPGDQCYLPSQAAYKHVIVTRGSQEILFQSPVIASYTDNGIVLPAEATSGLELFVASSDSSIAYVLGDSIIFNGTGHATLTITQPGNANYFAAAPAVVELTVRKGDQIITGNLLQELFFGQSALPLNVWASSLLAINVTSSDPSIVEVLGDSLYVKGVGNAVLTFTQEGDNYWNPAGVVEIPVVVNKGLQQIIVDEIATKRFTDEPFIPVFHSTNGLEVLVEISDTSIATIVDGSIVIKKAGETSLHFIQEGNAWWEFAETEVMLRIIKADQVIYFSEIQPDVFGTDEIVLNATANSGLPVVFEISETDVASLSGNTLIILNAGTITITARQPGDEQWNEAVPVSATLEIGRAAQSIEIDLPDSVLVNEQMLIVDYSISTGLPVTISSSDETIVAVKGDTLQLIAPGEVVLTFSHSGDRNYLPASNQDRLIVYDLVSASDWDMISYSVFPNPSSGIFNIEAKGELFSQAVITISNLTGKKIYQSELVGTRTKIDLSRFPQGVYFAVINSKYQSFSKKLLLKATN